MARHNFGHWWALASLPALILSGCANATSVAYHADAAHPVRTISISPEVPLPKRMIFYGLSEATLMGLGAGLGGAAGGALMAAGSGSRKPPADLGVAESLTNSFATELQRGGRFTVVVGRAADAELRIRVREYGFFQAGVMKREVKPLLSVQVQLIRRDGKVIWDRSRIIAQTNKSTPAALPEDLKRDPQLAVAALRTAARVLAADVAGQF